MRERLKNRIVRWLRRATLLALTVGLLCGVGVTALAATNPSDKKDADPATPEPIVVVQGNAVVDEAGNPTGFYELALAVCTHVYVNKTTNASLTAEEYQEAMDNAVAAEKARVEGLGDTFTSTDEATFRGTFANGYEDHNYPFHTVAAALVINTDVLTPVSWSLEKVEYDKWTDGTGYDGSYNAGNTTAFTKTGFARGIDVTNKGYTADIPDITKAALRQPGTNAKVTVPLMTVKPDEINLATAVVEDFGYDGDGHSQALLTLYAGAPSSGRLFENTQEVVVARFAYDLQRFPAKKVTSKTDPAFTVVDETVDAAGVLPITYLAGDVDSHASTAGQTVWYNGGSAVDGTPTRFYYYHGANSESKADDKWSGGINGETGKFDLDTAKTVGDTVLTWKTGGTPTAPSTTHTYSFLDNLLKTFRAKGGVAPEGADTLRLNYVNKEAFRKLTGGKGGNMILFYDWDDTLIGSLIVGNGDVRADVNDYVENNLVHPDLRAGTVLNEKLGGEVPSEFTTTGYDLSTLTGDKKLYYDLLTSNDREFTYRGRYNSNPAGTGDVYPDDPTDANYKANLEGSKFPLTNKLDYAFYRHLNTITTITDKTANTSEAYYTLSPLCADPSAALYPWAYGWAVVEDATNGKVANKADWPMMVDVEKVSATWTTFGVGELKDNNPAQLPSLLPTVTSNQEASIIFPGGLEQDWSTDDNRDPIKTPALGFNYSTSSTGSNSYLRFADFSDMGTLLKSGQDVIVVKAVYEQGTSLDLANNYTPQVEKPYYVRYGTVASSDQGSAYSVQFQYGRVYNGIGVVRTRDPAIRVEFTPDNKGEKGGPFYMKVPVDNVDLMDIEITPSGEVRSMNYVLVDQYGYTYVNGDQHSINGNEIGIMDNFNYYNEETGRGFEYKNRQGTSGFVLWATLQQLLERGTTAVATGDQTEFLGALTLQTVQDMNWKISASMEVNSDLVAVVQTRVYDAIEKAVNNGYVDDKGVAALGWHQLQYHIANYSSGGIFSGSSLMSESSCMVFDWCRLLDSCNPGGGVVVRITDMNSLLNAVYDANYNADTAQKAGAQEALDNLDMDWVANHLRLRSGSTGALLTNLPKFTDSATLCAKLKNLVDAAGGSTLTWYQIQHYLLTDAYVADDSDIDRVEHYYWWETEDIKPADVVIDTLAKLLKVLVDADSDLLSQIALKNFNDPGIINGANLRKDAVGDARADLTQFAAGDVTAFVNMLKAIRTSMADDTAFQALTAHQIQRYYLTGTLQDDGDIRKATQWWIDSATKPAVDYDTLLETIVDVQVRHTMSEAEFTDWLTARVIGGAGDCGFRAADDGTMFQDGVNMTGVASRVLDLYTWATIYGYYDNTSKELKVSWNQMQYYLINGTWADPPTAKLESDAKYDSWRPQFARDEVVTIPISDFASMLWAADQANSGIAGADGSLKTLTAALLNSFGFRTASGDLWTDADMNQAMADVAAAVKAVTDGGGAYGDTTWDQIQYALLHHSAAADAATAEAESLSTYWWYQGGTKATDLITALDAADKALGGREANLNTLSDTFYLRKSSGAAMTQAEVNALLKNAVQAAKTAGTNHLNLNWDDIQYYAIHGSLPATHADAVAESNENYWWKDGGVEVTNLATLLEAAKQAVSGRNAMLNTINSKLKWVSGDNTDTDNTQLYLRMDNNGTDLTTGDLPMLKGRLFALVNDAANSGVSLTSLNWDQIQYYLIKLALVDQTTAAKESDAKYWWKDGGEKPAPETATMGTLLEKVLALGSSDLKTWLADNMVFGFRSDATTVYTDASKLGSKLASFKSKAKKDSKFYDSANDRINASWYQVQYFIINGSLVDDATAKAAGYTSWVPSGLNPYPDWVSALSIGELDIEEPTELLPDTEITSGAVFDDEEIGCPVLPTDSPELELPEVTTSAETFSDASAAEPAGGWLPPEFPDNLESEIWDPTPSEEFLRQLEEEKAFRDDEPGGGWLLCSCLCAELPDVIIEAEPVADGLTAPPLPEQSTVTIHVESTADPPQQAAAPPGASGSVSDDKSRRYDQ